MTIRTVLGTTLAALAMTATGAALAQSSSMGEQGYQGGTAGHQGSSAVGGTRDPYSSGARSTDRFDPYTQGANQSTQQNLQPMGSSDQMMSGRYDPRMENRDTHYRDLDSLGSRTGMRSHFLDGA
ncbi:hypothetical protein [Cupriavidus sp. AU9028]|uniref:hypothetical protein n=1 Tax=Cupriavidus sp. AU9028 TaxID=2871157 RepID=UPI001C9516D7|nr:hypothetical protein [Cupriavidus sp. AU9028]MBY4898402.1 hypothetical protein [Cupriavidus sp. AU9028]